jgi:hypothetical protein
VLFQFIVGVRVGNEKPPGVLPPRGNKQARRCARFSGLSSDRGLTERRPEGDPSVPV